MLTYEYKKRISAREALNHKWFKNAPDNDISSEIME